MFQKLILTSILFVLLGSLHWPIPFNPSEPSPQSTDHSKKNGIVYRSSDDGLSWTPVEAGLPADMNVNYLGALDGRLLLGTRNYGLYQSDPNVANWRPSADVPFLWHKKISALCVAGREIYAGLEGEGLYKSADGGNVWLPVSENLPDKTVHAVMKRGNVLMAGTDNGIFKSANEGKTWVKVFARDTVNSLVERNDAWFAGTSRGVVRSRDDGANWEWVLDDGAAHQGDGIVHKAVLLDGNIAVLSLMTKVHPWKDQPTWPSAMVRVSKDQGKTWKTMDRGLPQGNVYAIVKTGNYWVCSHGAGVYRSADQGAHWTVVRLPFDMERFMDLISVNGVIYGGTGRFQMKGGDGC